MSGPDIHYWKCDRPEPFHGTGDRACGAESGEEVQGVALAAALGRRFETDRVEVRLAFSQGIHRTWTAIVDDCEMFVRIDDSPDGGDRLEMESAVLARVAASGVPVPKVYGCDSSRKRVPFAWQALSRVDAPDLNYWWKAGQLDLSSIAFEIGASVARWQSVPVERYGPFSVEDWRRSSVLRGFHAHYSGYFRLNLERHLSFLVAEGLLDPRETAEIADLVKSRADLLEGFAPCLVHKDLALWNMLGSPGQVISFIDFDDAIGGDPCDDLSLLACFHDGVVLARAVEGYASVRALPERFLERFWLHLLRNMVVKAVIRTGAGYFRRDAGFFLIAGGGNGEDLLRFTLDRLALATRALRDRADLSIL